MPSADPARTTGRRHRSPRPRGGLPLLVALLSLAALAAGVVTRMIPGLPTRQPKGAAERLAEEVIVDDLAMRAEARALERVVLQLELPRPADCPWPDCTVPWGHVPVFTRFDDGETSVVRAAYGSPAAVLRCSPDIQPDTAHVFPVVDEVLAGRLASALPPLAPGLPCPAAHGCADAEAIIRIRRGGRLDTFVVDGRTPPEARAIADEIIALLRNWAPSTGLELCDASSNNMETIWDITGTAEDAPPAADLLPEVDMEMFAWTGGGPPRMVDHGSGGQLVHTGSYGWTDNDGSPRPAAATASAQQGGWDFWEVMAYRPAGHWTVPMLRDPATFAMRLEPTMKLAVVPWIHKGRDVEDQVDVEVYAEALANAAAARANRQALEEAALVPTHPPDIAITVEHPDPLVPSTPPFSPPPAPTSFPTVPPVAWGDGPLILPSARGIQTWMQWYRYDEDRAALTRLRQAGFEWFKQRFAWADIQPNAGSGSQDIVTMHSDLYIQTVNDLGGRVMIQLAVPPAWAVDPGGEDPFDLTIWERFVGVFADRYRGRVDAYEIMNEPNLAREWGAAPDPAAYARVLGVAYDAIKAADPNAVVISAGLAPTGDRMPDAMGDATFLGALIEQMGGSTDGYLDAIGVHAAGFKAAPGVSPDEAAASAELGGDRTFTFRRVEDLRALMMERSRVFAPLVITEFGWTVDPRPDSPYHWAAVDPIERGTSIATVFEQNTALFENAMWLGGPMILFSAADRAWTAGDEAYWWAVADADGNVDGAVRAALGLGPGDPAGDAND